MPTNAYFTQGTKREQFLVEDLIIESLKIYGKDFYYIPRTLVAKDNILGEDLLSRYLNSFPIEMYIEDVDGFGGQGVFLQKFGIQVDKSATFVLARSRWEQLVGDWDTGILPNRPSEGDLIWFPMTQSMFELKFVENQDPFYQLGNLYVYKLRVEIFRYSHERIETGIQEIDEIESIYSLNELNYKIINEDMETAIILESSSSKSFDYIIEEEYDSDSIEPFANNKELDNEKNTALDFTESNPFGEI
jgi:hypothetical protein